MAYDKVIDSAELDAKLTAVADAIRTKGGATGELEFPDGFVHAVEGIQAGGGSGGDTSIEDGLLTNTLTEYRNDRITTLASTTFRYNSLIESIILPNATRITGEAFRSATKLHTLHIPKVNYIQTSSIRGCSGLKVLDMQVVTSIGSQGLDSCSSLKVLVLRGTGQVSGLGKTNGLAGTPFDNGGTGGVLLVPSALVESYKTATNWSAIYGYGTNRFLALEDYTLDGTATGEIDWDKVNALFEEASA